VGVGSPGRDVVVVGAGLSGSLMAVLLARRGCRVRVFERRPDPRVRSADHAARSTWDSPSAGSPRCGTPGCSTASSHTPRRCAAG
jgi:glycine/D-amino acid oxidase-like deaminating enzyme